MLVPPFARHSQLDSRYRMELGDQLSALIFEAGIRPTHYKDIQADDRLLQMWRGMSRDMYCLMRHLVGDMTAVTQLTRNLAHYRRCRAIARDG